MHKLELSSKIALKEWAVATYALLAGEQIVIMRKGGIIEETRHFEIQSQVFYLFPTYEHQRSELIKDPYKPLLERTLSEWRGQSEGDVAGTSRDAQIPSATDVTISAYAELIEDIEVFDKAQLDNLEPFHIWTEHFAEQRLKWKKVQPLHVMVLRIYRLETPVTIPVIEAYNGCKSWVRLEDGFDPKSLRAVPVMTDEQFRSAHEAIRQALGKGR